MLIPFMLIPIIFATISLLAAEKATRIPNRITRDSTVDLGGTF